MKNEEIADIFDRCATLLEFAEENPFRIRAYSNAALRLRELTEDVAAIRGRGELRNIPSIGLDLEKKIQEYLDTGKIEFYEKLLAKTPPILMEMIRIPGMGPKTAKLVYRRFKPKNLNELARIAASEKFKELPGVKEKTAQKIIEGVAFLKKNTGRVPIGEALEAARSLCEALESLPGALRVTYAGSVRRMCETVHDVDLLVASKTPAKIMDAFTRDEAVDSILAKGPTKSSVRLRSGLQADLRVVRPDEFGAALLYFTGSKEHNVKLRQIAKKKGWKVNEYGLFVEKTGKRLAGRTEEEMYKALGLTYVPPELREDLGEIEAAAKGKLPKLIERGDLLADFHLHSNWTDGNHEIAEMAEAARGAGLKYAVLTDHSRSLTIANGLSPERLKKQILEVRALSKKWKDFTLLVGTEVDILEDGALDFQDSVLSELDFVVASVHSRFKQDRDTMTRRIIRAVQNPHVDALGHPTGRRLSGRPPYEVDLDAVFRAAKDAGTAIEINGSLDRLDLNAANARRASETGVRFVINSDSHRTRDFSNLEFGIATARRAGIGKHQVLNCLPLEKFREVVSGKKTRSK